MRKVEGRRLPLLVIRADASAQMGTGHAMRCLALAQAWQDAGGEACFAMADTTPSIEARLASEGVEAVRATAPPGSPEDAAGLASLAWRLGAGWVAVDGYHFGGEYQRTVKAAGLRLLAADDLGHAEYSWADLILNQNLDASATQNSRREAYTGLLTGTEYALLRREFWPWRGWTREVRAAGRRVLVTMGGADPGNITARVLEALACMDLAGLEVRLVVGGSNPHLASLQDRLGVSKTLSAELMVDVPNMPELMAWADAAVSAAGSTAWELALLQTPCLLVILAENQRGNAEALAGRGAAVNLGWHGDLTPAEAGRSVRALLEDVARRRAMARRSGALVDGRGGARVAELLAGEAVRVRQAGEGDREVLFLWANDALTRKMSFSGAPIGWTEHADWYAWLLADPDATALIAEAPVGSGWEPVGSVRIDAEGVVSLVVAPDHRGRGLARPILATAVGACRARRPGCRLLARIRPENEASLRVFGLAGFRPAGEAVVRGAPCLEWVYE